MEKDDEENSCKLLNNDQSTDTSNNTDTHSNTTESSLSIRESSETVDEEKDQNLNVTEIKEDDTNESNDKNEEIKGSKEDQPEVQCTLESVSEEVDRYISTMLSSHAKEKEKEDEDKKEKENEGESSMVGIPEYVDKFLDLVEEKLKNHSEEDEISFFESVERVSKLLNSIYESKTESELESDKISMLINRIGSIEQRAMSYLEDEFRSLLEDYTKVPDYNLEKKEKAEGDAREDNESTERDSENSKKDEEVVNFPGYSQKSLSTLSKIVNQLIKGGYECECRDIYIVTRRNILEESLNQELAYEKLSIEEVHRVSWETLEREIPTWIRACKDCATVFFPGERKIVNEIFSNYNDQAKTLELFEKITYNLVIQFLSFAEAVAMAKRSTEKLFKVLDTYESLRDNIPVMESLFSDLTADDLKAESTTARCRLGETAICIFCDLENSIKADTGKSPVPGGAVHPLTRYTMNYLKYACEYNTTLEQVFRDHSKIERVDSAGRKNFEADSRNSKAEKLSAFACQMMSVMDLLDSNLEGKSKLYKDIALSSIFMMNNGRYILQKFKGSSEIHQVMGDTWCRKKSSDLRNYHKTYQRETWGRLISCLSHEKLNVNGKVAKPVLKERFKSFNATFDEIHKTQSTWVVSDEQLQSELRVSISAVVIPAYRSFLGRFSQYLDPGRQTEKYIKLQPEDIENYIDDLFDGTAKKN